MGNVAGRTQEKMTPEEKKQIEEEINTLIRKDPVVIFSKTYCPYCTMAKRVFQKLNTSYNLIELNENPRGSKFQTVLGEMTGASTVPRVFVNGRCIGGGSETESMFNSGSLQKMLE